MLSDLDQQSGEQRGQQMELQGAQQSEPGQDLGCKLKPRRDGRRPPKRYGLLRSWVASNRIEHGVGSGAALGSTLLFSDGP